MPPPGVYNVPLEVALSTAAGWQVQVKTAGGWSDVPGPVALPPSGVITARVQRAADGSSGPERDLRYLIQADPLSPAGRWTVADPAPIRQSITRSSFLTASGGDPPVLVVGTLESWSRRHQHHEASLAGVRMDGTLAWHRAIPNATEVRTHAWSEALQAYVLGTSLYPGLVVLDPARRSVEPLWAGPREAAFLHGVGLDAGSAFVVVSSASPGALGGALLRVPLDGGPVERIPFPDPGPQGWGAVESVDPTGRVWLYRAFPVRPMWYSGGSFLDRQVPGWGGWQAVGWDLWRGAYWLTLWREDAGYRKVAVNPQTLRPEAVADGDAEDAAFRASLRADLHHREDPRIGLPYVDPLAGSIHVRRADRLVPYGGPDLGEAVSSPGAAPTEEGLRWNSPHSGELRLLGMLQDGRLAGWAPHARSLLALAPDGAVDRIEASLPAQSPADITALAVGGDGAIYGGGFLTTIDLFRHDPATGSTAVLRGAVPNLAGQVNLLEAGPGGTLFGVAYPDSVPFRYLPGEPWRPGTEAGANPFSLPSPGGGQMRAYRSTAPSASTLWFESVSDYAATTTSALVRADFASRAVRGWTTSDAGFSPVLDLLALGDGSLLLLVETGGGPTLRRVDPASGAVQAEALAPAGASALGPSPLGGIGLLVAGLQAYVVDAQLGAHRFHQAEGQIRDILPLGGSRLVVLARGHVEILDPFSRGWAVVQAGAAVGSPLFPQENWTPAAVGETFLYVGQNERLLALALDGSP